MKTKVRERCGAFSPSRFCIVDAIASLFPKVRSRLQCRWVRRAYLSQNAIYLKE
ncbi:MAG TPA: hypothetical protein V6C85_26175 [Allocoleopsis sp.]